MFTHLDYLYQVERRKDQIRAAERNRLRRMAEQGTANSRRWRVALMRLAGVLVRRQGWRSAEMASPKRWSAMSDARGPLFS